MSAETGISWCDSTHNHWIGCAKISPGCDNCYAAVSTPVRTMRIVWGAGEQRHLTSAQNRNLPRRWNAAAPEFNAQHGRRQRVFCSSLSDVFDNQVDPEWRAELWTLIRETSNLDWLLLTKRIGNVPAMLPTDWGDGWPNVWFGITVVNQEEADRDIPKLLATPARVRFLSMEPLLADVDLSEWLFPYQCCRDCPCPNPRGLANIDEFALQVAQTQLSDTQCCGNPAALDSPISWVIVGGESGPQARKMDPKWADEIRWQCEAAGVPFFFKQAGGRDKDKGGCLLGGLEFKAWPEVAA